MANDFYTPSGAPSSSSFALSATMRAEFALVQAAFDKMPSMAGHASEFVTVNSGATGLEPVTATVAKTRLGLTIGTDVQAYSAKLAAIAALAVTDGNIIVGDGATFVAESGATARTSLGLGSIATQASSAVSITGGTITGITDLTVADGGTGASSAAAARTNLGVTATGGDTTYAFRANNLSDLANATTARTNLGAQASSSVLTALAASSISGTITVSTSSPSGGSDNDIWLQRAA